MSASARGRSVSYAPLNSSTYTGGDDFSSDNGSNDQVSYETNYTQLFFNIVRSSGHMLEYTAAITLAYHASKLFTNIAVTPLKLTVNFAAKKTLGEKRIHALSSSILFNNSLSRKMSGYFTPNYKELLIGMALSATATVSLAAINFLSSLWLRKALESSSVQYEIDKDYYFLPFVPIFDEDRRFYGEQTVYAGGVLGLCFAYKHNIDPLYLIKSHLFVNVFKSSKPLYPDDDNRSLHSDDSIPPVDST